MRKLSKTHLNLIAFWSGIFMISLFSAYLMPQNPYDLSQLNFEDQFLSPFSKTDQMVFLLGSDEMGRDLFSLIFYGLKTTFLISFGSVGISIFVGLFFGLIAAYKGGIIDSLIMRLVDLCLALPSLLIVLMVFAFFGQGFSTFFLALILVQWAYFARMTRQIAKIELGKPYILASQCLHIPTYRILFLHLLPLCLPSLMVVFVSQIGQAILLESTLSFFGIGLPINEPTLGYMIFQSLSYISYTGEYGLLLFPAFVLFFLVFSIHLIGEFLRQKWIKPE